MNIADWLMANGDSLQFRLFFALLAALMVAERWLPRRPGSMDRAFRWSSLSGCARDCRFAAYAPPAMATSAPIRPRPSLHSRAHRGPLSQGCLSAERSLTMRG
jgi:hypothetical protein